MDGIVHFSTKHALKRRPLSKTERLQPLREQGDAFAWSTRFLNAFEVIERQYRRKDDILDPPRQLRGRPDSVALPVLDGRRLPQARLGRG